LCSSGGGSVSFGLRSGSGFCFGSSSGVSFGGSCCVRFSLRSGSGLGFGSGGLGFSGSSGFRFGSSSGVSFGGGSSRSYCVVNRLGLFDKILGNTGCFSSRFTQDCAIRRHNAAILGQHLGKQRIGLR
jgi:hypothetical protein